MSMDEFVTDLTRGEEQRNALEAACNILVDAGVILTTNQFKLGIGVSTNAFISINDVASLLDCSNQWIRKLTSAGRLEVYKLNPDTKKFFIGVKELYKLIKSHRDNK